MARYSRDLLRGPWARVLDHLGEAVIVLDGQRILQHVNEAARRLLGYKEGQEIGGRCKLTTRGVDCEHACPLTFALDNDLEQVEDFATVYHTADGRELPLRITVIPLFDEDGSFAGAAEILRPTEPNSGFFLAGRSPEAESLRGRVVALSRSRGDVYLVGEPPACRDVARALHRFSGIPENLFRLWSGSWDEIDPWPPGTLFVNSEEAESVLEGPRPEGWRIVVGAAQVPTSGSLEILELPKVETLEDDLPYMIVTWVEELAPGTRIAPDALRRLARLARERGLQELQEVLVAALAAADECIEETHLPVDGYGTALVDELLKSPKPLAALEERLIREVLDRCCWRMQEAADRIGISRVTLWRKMKDLGIEKGS